MAQSPDQIKTYIKARLSLRAPQSDSLDILHHLFSDVDLETVNLDVLLEKIKELKKSFSDFDFDFPSMCFALATGVGKTRLMGAMIYYLYKTKGIRNFFVVAPNLTIYNKLLADFTYGSNKYVFKGLSDVDGQNPLIVHGDNYAEINHVLSQWFDWYSHKFTINVFNIAKFNSKKESTKLKNFSEYIWESYFSYLQNLKDLVVLMDESHRYRADSSMQAINDLKPVLGLEFTATPFTVKGSKKNAFNNVIYQYNLANAIQDWFVKTPWVATRENTDVSKMSKEELDFLKISDGIAIHERTKTELQLYADNYSKPFIKPFLMISAENQAHADHIESLIKTQLFDGRYKDKVIKIYSWQSWADEEENIQKLLEVEKSTNPVEIVVQVMMLKEWWDVNNLYTIVPLRASTSEILTEQTIWRWLRLPYGERVGVESVDRLTIVAHDRYQEVIKEAQKADSLIKNVVNLDDINNTFTQKMEIVKTKPTFLDESKTVESNVATQEFIKTNVWTKENAIQAHSFVNETITQIIEESQWAWLNDTEIQKKVENRLFESIQHTSNEPAKLVFWNLTDDQTKKFVNQRVQEVFRDLSQYAIQIPRVNFYRPDPEPRFNTNFRINTWFLQWLISPESAIRLQKLTNNDIERIKITQQINFRGSVRDYFVNLMMELPELDYDTYSDWMYSMADDMVKILKDTLGEKSDDEYKLHIHLYKDYVANEIKKQLLSTNCYSINIKPGEVRIYDWNIPLKWATYSFIPWCSFDFRETNFDKQKIKSYIFWWFRKTSEEFVKFDSDTERKMSVILENDEKVLKRIKPREFSIDYYFENKREGYRPDFVVETIDSIYIIEPKNAWEVDDWKVQAKKQYTLEWIDAINKNTQGKKWKYSLIADSNIKETYTFDYVVSLGS